MRKMVCFCRYSFKYSTMLFFCVIIQTGMLPNSSVAVVYENSSYHYTLEIPDDWEKMDQSVLKQFDAGFTKKQRSSAYLYPNMLIDHKKMKITFNGLAKQYKIDLNSVKKENSSLTKESNFKEAIIDMQKKNIIIPATFKVDKVGDVKGLTAIFLGKNGIVRLYFYSIADEFEKDLPIFNAILDSLRFKKGYENNERDNVKLYDRQPMLKTIGSMTIGAIIGLGVFRLISFLRSKKKVS